MYRTRLNFRVETPFVGLKEENILQDKTMRFFLRETVIYINYEVIFISKRRLF